MAKQNAPLFNFSKGNYILMDNYIISHDFSLFYSSTDVEFLWSYLKSVKQHPVWYTGDIVRKLHHLKSLRKKATSSPTVNNILTLKATEKSLSFNISLAKSKYESHLFSPTCITTSSSTLTLKSYVPTTFYVRVVHVPTSIFLLILCNIRPLLINTISLLITSWVLTCYEHPFKSVIFILNPPPQICIISHINILLVCKTIIIIITLSCALIRLFFRTQLLYKLHRI